MCREDGSLVNPGTISHNFSDSLKEAGLHHIRFHDLRHSYATLLRERGVDMKTVSERLGHSSIQITMDYYGHVTPKLRNKATEAVEDMFRTIQRMRAEGEESDEDDSAASEAKK